MSSGLFDLPWRETWEGVTTTLRIGLIIAAIRFLVRAQNHTDHLARELARNCISTGEPVTVCCFDTDIRLYFRPYTSVLQIDLTLFAHVSTVSRRSTPAAASSLGLYSQCSLHCHCSHVLGCDRNSDSIYIRAFHSAVRLGVYYSTLCRTSQIPIRCEHAIGCDRSRSQGP